MRWAASGLLVLVMTAGTAAADGDVADRAEAAATRAEAAADRSEAAAKQVEDAAARLERLVDEFERRQERRAGGHKKE
ncbi:MAG TPA: hypothetical protein VMS22_19825 [Candidatus Eisenbacteria bacterium]|jgi:hypothetical protein|nr:hypothetical protein [Candidatus Eisenbacteria bacterium]